jgi:hypothetical protein|tara:strand:+ start:2175 stop:2570 length:396 start_codon:yes stop_codon:yes gene_type:complete
MSELYAEGESQTSINKKELVDTVKKWVELDNKLRTANTATKKLREEKKLQNAQMIAIMKKHEIDNFSIKDGEIQYKKETRRETLTQKLLLSILTEHPQLSDDQAITINQYVYDKRKTIEKESVVLKGLGKS